MYPFQNSTSYDKISNQYQVFLNQLANQSESTIFEEAKINPV
jgi:hypothetical protein